MRLFNILSFLLFSLMVLSCGKSSPSNTAVTASGEEVTIAGEVSKAAIEDKAFYASMSEMLVKGEEDLPVDKDGPTYCMNDVPIGGAICFTLVKEGNGSYRLKPIDGYTGEGYELASIELRQVGDVLMLIGFTSDRKPMLALRGFDSMEGYNQYRSECYKDILAGTYTNGEGEKVVFSSDGSVSGLFGVNNHPYQQLTYMDYTSEICHIDGTDLFFSFASTDEGIDIYDVQVDEESDGEMMMGDELQMSLQTSGTPDVKWVHQHAVTSDIVLLFMSSVKCKAALEELQKVKSPTAVEAWNLFILKTFEEEIEEEES